MAIGTIFTGDITDAIGELDRFVPVVLTDRELIIRAGEWASAHKKVEEAKSELDSVQGSLKVRIKRSELEETAEPAAEAVPPADEKADEDSEQVHANEPGSEEMSDEDDAPADPTRFF